MQPCKPWKPSWIIYKKGFLNFNGRYVYLFFVWTVCTPFLETSTYFPTKQVLLMTFSSCTSTLNLSYLTFAGRCKAKWKSLSFWKGWKGHRACQENSWERGSQERTVTKGSKEFKTKFKSKFVKAEKIFRRLEDQLRYLTKESITPRSASRKEKLFALGVT